ncbi:MAG: S-methyl-5'-thioadenosine phosphorylase [Verrucomicrobiales bacterium]|nr:S-methyl-5'-thioadenosine phosphorylase [Verrucomicrobiales bacterium]
MAHPPIGIIGGSGLYQIDGLENPRWVKVRTPFGDPSDALLRGTLGGREVVFLPRHGRGHRLLPSELPHRANLWALRSLGVRWVLSVSAVGSLQKKYRPRDFVFIDQFVDRTKQSLAHTFCGRGIVAHVAFAHPVAEELRQLMVAAARRLKLRAHDGGTYVCMEGPAFSTRAESMANRAAGFDVIGMTNLGEAKCAREAEVAYATAAMVTDYDCWNEDHDHVTVEMVVGNLMANAESARRLVTAVIPTIPTVADWPCHRALKDAILTPREHWPAKTLRELKPILGPYR